MISTKKITLFAALLLMPVTVLGDEAPVAIGLMSELSGPFSANGVACQLGYKVANAEYAALPTPKRAIKFVFSDSKGEATTGVTELKRLAEVDHILGLVQTRSQIGMALNPISKQKKIPMAGIVGHRDFISGNPYAFRVYPSVQAEAQKLVDQLQLEKLNTAAVLTLEDEWTISLSEEFEQRFKATGGKVIFSEHVVQGSSDWQSLATRIKSLNPQVIFANLGPGASGAALRKLKDLDVNGRKLSNFWAQQVDELKVSGVDAAEGLSFIEMNLDQPRFSAAIEKIQPGTKIVSVHYACYVGASLMIQAALAAPKLETSEDLMRQLQQMNSVKLLDETLPLRGREVIYSLKVKTIRSGKKVVE